MTHMCTFSPRTYTQKFLGTKGRKTHLWVTEMHICVSGLRRQGRAEWKLVLTQARGLVCKAVTPTGPFTDLRHFLLFP